MATDRFIVEVEKGKEGVDGGSPSVGSVYRSIYAKDGFPEPADDLLSCWDIFRASASTPPEHHQRDPRSSELRSRQASNEPITRGALQASALRNQKPAKANLKETPFPETRAGDGGSEQASTSRKPPPLNMQAAPSPPVTSRRTRRCSTNRATVRDSGGTRGRTRRSMTGRRRRSDGKPLRRTKKGLRRRHGRSRADRTPVPKTDLTSLSFLSLSFKIDLSAEKSPDNPMLGRREIVDGKAGKYVWQTYKEVYDIVIKLGNSIRTIGVGKGEKCGIYGANSPEWIISMEACNAHGLYCVPLYDTLGAGAIEFIICHAEVSLAFSEEKKISELLKTAPNSTKYLKNIVSFGEVSNVQRAEAERHGLSIYSWDQFLKLGEGKHYELPEKKRSDICTIMYTSGTTGDPKGVLLTNESIIYLLEGVKKLLKTINEELTSKDVYLSYLPLAHIFDRVIEELFIYEAASIGFWRGDVKILVEDIAALKPTIFCAVPRVLERIYNGLQQKLSDGGFLKKTLFNFAFNYKHNNMVKGKAHEQAAPIFDKIVFKKVKEGLGGRVRLILSGAAPLAAHIESFLRVVACAHVLQGYGLTESCGGTFVSIPNELQMLGTVGPPVPNVDIRLESVPEMGYDALASKPRGEICIRGKTLFSGYYKREDLTQEVFIDGWLHTGDVGEWQPDGAMKIIDRKKNIFKLSQGEYVAVENLENIYSHVAAIESIWVYGNSYESYLVAVVCPSKIQIEHWAKEHNVSGDFETICQNQKTKEFILGEFNRVAKDKKLKGFELIKGVHLDTVPFDMERDLITPSYKKKRPQLLKYYQKEIDEMYNKTKN
uniref:Long-chain-fatty-acid--CoA ligase n=1 Tax=Brassica campestris TaxID=3711 RepID=M4EFY7_BRACM